MPVKRLDGQIIKEKYISLHNENSNSDSQLERKEDA
jgi:hypothetical protein